MVAVVPASAIASQRHSAKPPSFALWTVNENNYEDSLTTPITDQCAKAFGKDDKKAGECLVAGVLRVYPKMDANWERGLARIAKRQSAPCKKAIHAYWLAARKNFAAATAYFKSHRTTAATQIQSDLADEPYATIKSVKDEAKSHAIRVCG